MHRPALNDAGTDALVKDPPRLEPLVQEALLQVGGCRKPGEHDQAAALVGQIDPVVAVGEQQHRPLVIGEGGEVVLHLLRAYTHDAVGQACGLEPLEFGSGGGEHERPAGAADRSLHERVGFGRVARGAGKDEEASARAVLVPTRRDREPVDLRDAERALEFTARAERGRHVDPLLGPGEGVVLSGRRDQRPDQDLVPGDIDEAVLERIGDDRAGIRVVVARVRRDHLTQHVRAPNYRGRRDELNLIAEPWIQSYLTHPLGERTWQRVDHIGE